MSNCKSFFNMDDSYFEGKSCINTASEIAGQPELWNRLAKILLSRKREISGFMERLGDLRKMRIILTGAGSSAFVGEALAGFAAKSAEIKCEAVHTTDIVSAPKTVLFPDIPTLLISFGRSGNSPESAGAVEYARRLVKNLYEVAVVCEKDSKLYDITSKSGKGLILLMPEGSNDKGFAMTASVTCMMLSAFALLNYEKIDEISKDIERLSENVARDSLKLSKAALQYAEKSFDRAAYLGSGALKGLMHEGMLKMMELTNGAVNACFDSAAGFRHGPKTVIKPGTISLHFISGDAFTAKYDVDLFNEMTGERDGNIIVAISANSRDEIKTGDVVRLSPDGYGFAADICTGINGLVFLQMLAMYKSLELNVPTDNPSPGGQVNRVVKGVVIYPLQ